MSKLHFLKNRAISATSIRESEEHDEIIAGLLFSKTMTFLYGGKGIGKSWVALGISNHVCQKGYEVIYIDNDNSISTAKDRELDKLIERLNGRFWYVNADNFDDPKADSQAFFAELKERAQGGTFKNVIVVLDSLAFAVDDNLNDDNKLHKIFAVAKAIRRDGGTIIFLNHSVKKGGTMAGNAAVERNADTIFEVQNVCPTDEAATHVILAPEKFRLKCKETGWTIPKATLEMIELDPVLASMSEAEKEFVEAIKQAIQKSGDGISQNALLETLGKTKDDRVALNILHKHIGRFWITEDGKRKAKIYKLQQSQQSQQSITSTTNTSVATVASVADISSDDDFISDVRFELALADETPQSLLLMRLEKKYKNMSHLELLKKLEQFIDIYWSRELKDGFSMYKVLI
ncbi:MAG: AAA family ATPase [Campylobacterales bacterium]|nr:AAA family ATPase [Campylobacterales bacterium]